MKTKSTLLAIHKTFEKDAIGERDVVLFVSDGTSIANVKKVIGDTKIAAFIESIPANSTVRFTAIDGSDQNLIALQDRGVIVKFAHWHVTGIQPNQLPEEIVYQYASLDESLLRSFKTDKQLVELRRAVITRNAVLEFYGDAVRRIRQVARNAGVLDETSDEQFKDDLSALTQIKSVVGYGDDKKVISWDTRVEHVAKNIPECVLFAKIAGFTSLGTAAAIVAYANGIERFPDVASFWSYCGQSVVDGAAPKRKKGNPVNWSPKMRTIIYNMMESIIKQPKNPWNALYKQYKKEELAVHLEKHPGCKAPLGHSHNRAKRKVAKEILKRFYLAATSQKFEKDHLSIKPFSKNLSLHKESENHLRGAA